MKGALNRQLGIKYFSGRQRQNGMNEFGGNRTELKRSERKNCPFTFAMKRYAR